MPNSLVRALCFRGVVSLLSSMRVKLIWHDLIEMTVFQIGPPLVHHHKNYQTFTFISRESYVLWVGAILKYARGCPFREELHLCLYQNYWVRSYKFWRSLVMPTPG
jgi:hypothetical protein